MKKLYNSGYLGFILINFSMNSAGREDAETFYIKSRSLFLKRRNIFFRNCFELIQE